MKDRLVLEKWSRMRQGMQQRTDPLGRRKPTAERKPIPPKPRRPEDPWLSQWQQANANPWLLGALVPTIWAHDPAAGVQTPEAPPPQHDPEKDSHR